MFSSFFLIWLANTIYDICDTQENERRFDDKIKRTKLFHKGADFGMRIGVTGRGLLLVYII